jgi:hypothetical protein
MVQCLITKLNGVVNNNSIPKLGELIVEVNDANNAELELYGATYDNDVAVRTSGNVTVTNSSSAKKLISGTGKVFLSTTGTSKPIGFTTWRNNKLAFPNLNSAFLSSCSSINIDAGGYKLDLRPQILSLQVNNAYLIGKLGTCTLINCSKCILNDNENLDLNTLDVSQLTSFSWTSGKITGDISRLDSVHAPKLVKQASMGLWGNISTLTGDVSKLLKNGGQVLFSKEKLTWSNRPSDYKILAISANLGNNVDTMLTDQAKLDAGDTYYQKVMNVKGTRTSASDAAVTTLQGKGFTISVTPA